MATPQLIDINNYDTLLVESTVGRAGTPNGNIFFDTAKDRVEIITAEENPTVDLGYGLEANPLTNALGITMQAIYAFERQQRGLNVALRKFLPGVDGTYKFAGAFLWDNGIKPAADATSTTNNDDRFKIRGSGWEERAANGAVDRIYFGVRSLNPIQVSSQPYYQIADSSSAADLQAAAPVDFFRAGPIDEAIQVFGTIANGDADAGEFDYTTKYLDVKVRTFGYSQGSANNIATGIAVLSGFSAGFGIGEIVSPTSAFDEADVFGVGKIPPFDTMTYTHYDTPQTKTGFSSSGPGGASGDFSDVIANPDGGTLAQLRAFMDALMRQDTDQDAGAGEFYPKRADPLYTINSEGKLVTRAGLYLENIPTADLQGVVQTSDDLAAKVYAFNVEIRIKVSDAWQADPNAWGTLFFTNGAGGLDFGTNNAVIVNDAEGNPIVVDSTDVVGSAGNYEIVTSFDYDGNEQAGRATPVDTEVIFLAEGDGTAQAANAVFTITRQAIVSASALSETETNL